MNTGRILIVEDDERAGREFQTALTNLGYSVPAVSKTGQEALALVADLSPDLVLLNVRLAGQLDGIQTANLMQRVSTTPVIFLCEPADDLSMNRAHASYPYGYLVKPVAEADLQRAVESALRSAGAGEDKRKTETLIQALHGLTQGLIAADLAGNVAYLNREAEELTGWAASEALGQPMGDIFRISGDGRRPTLRRKDGSRVVIVDDTTPLESGEGSLIGMVTVFRKASAEGGGGGGEVQEQLASIASSIADPLMTLDAEWQITHLNSQAAEFYRAPREELIGRDFWADFGPGEQARYEPEFQRALDSGLPHTFELLHRTHETWFQISAYPFASGLLVILRDISRQKQLDEERRRLEQLEGLSLLARGFAHDFNNLLTVMLGSLSIARNRSIDDPALATELGDATAATLKAQDLVQQLMTFAQGGAPIKEAIALQQLLVKIVEDRRRDLPDNVQIQIVLNQSEAEAQVYADTRQLRRLIENLLLNAEQAIGDNGVIFVRLRRDPAASPDSREMLVIEVIDSGAGMDPATIGKAFDPFFTTRRQSNATGLGLTVCESIARAHGGLVRLQSKVGKGAIASVFLPIHQPGSEAILLQAPVAANGGNGGRRSKNGSTRILILEDEMMIRRLINATLTQAGFKVHETREGQETIDAYQEATSSGHPFDLLIMDLSIEDGMGGVEAISRIKAIDPDVRAIVSSGYCDDPAMANPAAYGFSAVLAKPYQPKQLVEMVKRMTAS